MKTRKRKSLKTGGIKMDDFAGYPKYQYSVFLKNGRDEQIVIRTNDWDEFLGLKKNVNKILQKVEEKKTIEEAFTPAPSPAAGPRCPKCGGALIERTSKTGKNYTKCENGKWNAEKGINEGCDYVKWND